MYIYIYIYIPMAPKSSNGNTATSTNSIDVDLKPEQDSDRTWADKDRSPEFHNEYDESQENNPLSTSSDVHFKTRIKIKGIK